MQDLTAIVRGQVTLKSHVRRRAVSVAETKHAECRKISRLNRDKVFPNEGSNRKVKVPINSNIAEKLGKFRAVDVEGPPTRLSENREQCGPS